ncbi:MAG: hypothetical protein KUG78_21925 [Kangiellaceae bacterium]|nr:hypothetical protein [Kangiellaceae bacterium]
MPAINTLAYKLLAILADGLPHPKKDLMSVIGDDPRSALQVLRGEAHGFWLIHNIGSPKGVYQLARRHLSGNRELDIQARTQRELAYLQATRRKAEMETERLPRAIKQEVEAKLRIQQSFSFYHKNTEKPTSIVKSKQA